MKHLLLLKSLDICTNVYYSMPNMKLNIYTLTVCLCFVVCSITTMAQTTNQQDPARYILKYDTAFSGVGPTIYFLPLPRSKEDVLVDDLDKLDDFNDAIRQAFLYQDLLKSFAQTANYAEVAEIIKVKAIAAEDWHKVSQDQLDSNNQEVAIGILNALAKQYILKQETDKAELLLTKALDIATQEEKIADIDIVLSNLSSVYFYNKNFLEAGKTEEAYYKAAILEKSIINQGKSLVRIATILAFDKDYNAAESTIIRKAIPLFNKAKDYDSKINAWVKLAKIYQLNNRHPEAQWFLLQAKELSALKNITTYNTDIEYMLGYSKFIQNNLIVSQKELTGALSLAQKEGNKYIELSAIQLLGQISTKQNRMLEAEQFLLSYWKLRNELF